MDDLSCAIAHVRGATRTGRDEVDLVGCSLGAALAFAHLACVPEAPVHSVVSLGGLVTWVKIHAVLRAAFWSPWLVGRVRVRDTRKLAGHALYFEKVVPLIGGALSDRAAYRYLPRSMAYLPSPADMVGMLRAVGFPSIRRLQLSGGITQLFVGTRA